MTKYSARSVLTGLLAISWLAGCTGPTIDELRAPVPEPLVATANVAGYYSLIRFWGDDASAITPEAR
jgi:hypothetical protein